MNLMIVMTLVIGPQDFIAAIVSGDSTRVQELLNNLRSQHRKTAMESRRSLRRSSKRLIGI